MEFKTTEGTLLTRHVSRRSMLRGGASFAGGLALFVIGCSSDDDEPTPTTTATATTEATVITEATVTAEATEAATEEPTAEPTTEATVEPTSEATTAPAVEPTSEATTAPAVEPTGGLPDKVVVQSVSITGDDGVVVLRNLSDAAVDLDGWYICQRPSYWQIPTITLEPGGEVRLHAGAGSDGGGDLFAGGEIGSLGGGRGEIGLYRSGSFSSADEIVSFVAWNGSSGRTSVAREAGIWGTEDLEATDGDTLVFVGPGEDASGWAVQ